MRRLVTAVTVAFLTIVLTLPVFAHASLLGAQPADGAVLPQAPTELVLTFNEPVSPLAMLLVGLDGTTRPLDEVSAEGNTLRIVLPAAQVGTQVISWRAISTDGHPIAGTTSFSVGTADAEPAAAEALPLHSEVAPLLWVARIMLFVGLFFGAGGAAFRALSPVLPQPAKRLSVLTAVTGMGAALLVIGLQGLDILGFGLGDIAQRQVWAVGVDSVYGHTSLVAIGALIAALAALRARGGVGKSVGIAAILLVGLAISLSGHASVAQPQWLMKPALFIHVVAIAWWVGALYPLILLLRAEPGVATTPLVNFSRAIPFAVAPLVVSGLVLAVVQMGMPGPAWLSGYGAILAAKLLLLAALFGLASWNRLALTTPAAAGDAMALLRMRRSIMGEIVLVLAILCLVAGWRFTPPPRALAVEQPTTAELRLAQGDLVATVRVMPARVGPVDFAIALSTVTGTLVSPKAVRVSAAPLDADLAPVVRPAEVDTSGTWHVAHMPLAFPGAWTLEIEVRVSDFELTKLRGEFDLTP